MDQPNPPALRASDADRERAADTLRRAAGDGRLTIEELDERLRSAYDARTRAELELLVADVVAPDAAARAAQRMPVRRGEGGTGWVVAIMSGSDRQGRWRLAPRCTVLNIMGGSNLDLNDAELSAEQTELRVISIMGGADIYVPEGLNVEVSDFAFMGGNEVDDRQARTDPDGPVLRVRFFSLMGGSNLRRGRKRRRDERRRHLGH
jgi:Domain of unknown function (DUF1707)/Cell wall-active antibiotics response 4TMS YvqF